MLKTKQAAEGRDGYVMDGGSADVVGVGGGQVTLEWGSSRLAFPSCSGGRHIEELGRSGKGRKTTETAVAAIRLVAVVCEIGIVRPTA